jgi:hypothetical protein
VHGGTLTVSPLPLSPDDEESEREEVPHDA